MKVKKFRRTLASVSVLTISGAILAGCGTGTPSSNSSSSSSSSAGSNQTGNSASTTSTGSNKGTLKIIMWVNPPAVAAIQKIDAEFTKKYGVQVDLQTTANRTTNYAAAEQTAVQAGSADIMAIEPVQPLPQKVNSNTLSQEQEWAINKVFMPLNNQPWVSKFNQADLAAAAYNGQDYGLVTGVYQTGVFYNKAMFKKYNLQVPTTYNQLIQISKTLKSHGVTPAWDGLGGGVIQWLQFIMYPLMMDELAPQLNGASADQALASGRIKWTDATMLKVFQREQQYASNYLEPNYAGQDWQQMPGAFAAGKSAMLFDGSWDVASVLKANPNIQVGYFPFPGSNTAANNKSVLNADLTWVVLNSSKHKTLAEEWLNFFASKPIYSQYVQMTGISPSENGTFTSATQQIMGKWFGTGRLIQQSANFLIPSGPYYLQPTNFWATQLKMTQGGMTPAQLAQDYQTSQNQALK